MAVLSKKVRSSTVSGSSFHSMCNEQIVVHPGSTARCTLYNRDVLTPCLICR